MQRNIKIKASPYTYLFFNEFKLDPLRTDYNIVFHQVIFGLLDIDKLNRTLCRLVKENILFGCHLIEIDKILYWTPNQDECRLAIFDAKNKDVFVDEPFDLTSGPLYRFGLFKFNDTHYELILVIHHALIDGRDYDEFLYWIESQYNNEKMTSCDVKIQTRKILELNQALEERVSSLKQNGSELFWRELLSSSIPTNMLPYFDIKGYDSSKVKVGEVRFSVNFDIMHDKNKIGSLFNFLMLVWGILIAKYCGQTQAKISYPIGIKEGIGLQFGAQINSIIMPVDFSRGESFSDLYSKHCLYIKKLNASSDIKHSHLPTFNIIESSNSAFPNVAFAQSNLKKTPIRFDGCQSEIISEYNFDIAGTDLLLRYQEDNSSNMTLFSLLYKEKLFPKSFINNIQKSYTHLLHQFTFEQSRPVLEVSALSQQQQIAALELGKSKQIYSSLQTLHQTFESQAAKNPNHIAVVYQDKLLTYKELNEKANKVAHHIRKEYKAILGATLQPDTLIPICLDRGIDMVVSIIAVLKTGAAYVPIDPDLPFNRIKYILKDVKAQMLLTDTSSEGKIKLILSDLNSDHITLSENGIVVVDKDEYFENGSRSNLSVLATHKNLAYVIYTSGTTGKPKGVMQPHQNIIRLFKATEKFFNFSKDDVWSLYHSCSFDFSVWELWGALLYGGKLIIPTTPEVKDFNLFYKLITSNGVTVLNQTPTAFYQLLKQFINSVYPKNSKLRYIIFGGEALNISKLKPWWIYSKKNNLPVKLFNMYGITETTVHVTLKQLNGKEKRASNIGKPLPDLSVYLLDPSGNPVPHGTIGEMYIGGAGLSKGYLNNPELTKERFISGNSLMLPDKLKCNISRLYKTGDLGRYLPNNDLEYMGRNDCQVKIRGYRIELGEVEFALSRLKEVQESVVLAITREIEGVEVQQLVAYYVSAKPLEIKKLIEQLQMSLPSYMVPSLFVRISEIPLTHNGKLNQSALPTPNFSKNLDLSFAPPRNLIERRICKIWKEFFGLPNIGIFDDFFQIGGDSISTINMAYKLQDAALNITVQNLYEYRTIARLASLPTIGSNTKEMVYKTFSLVDKSKLRPYIKANEIDRLEDIYPVSCLQAGMLFEEGLSGCQGTYHSIFIYKLNKQLDIKTVKLIWDQLIKKHSLLRTGFLLHPQYGYCGLQYKNISSKEMVLHVPLSEISEIFEKEKKISYNVSNPGLFKLFLADNMDESFLFMFSAHHAIEDGWSVASLLAEFVNAYAYKTPIKTEVLPNYGEFVSCEMEAISNSKHENFWINYLYGIKPYERVSSLSDLKKPQIEISVTLSKVFSKSLSSLAKLYSVSEDVLFIAAYALSLTSLFASKEVMLGLVVNNRLEKDGGDRLFGLFLNTIPFRFCLDKSQNAVWSSFLSMVQDEKMKVYRHRQYPYAKIREAFKPDESIYNCAFNYIHFRPLEEPLNNKTMELVDIFERTDIPLTLHAIKHAKRFIMHVKCNPHFIDEIRAKHLLKDMKYYLSCLVEDDMSFFPSLGFRHPERLSPLANSYTPLQNRESKQEQEEDGKNSELMTKLLDKISIMWSQTLGSAEISKDDNFFDVGGNSLLLIVLQAKLQEQLKIKSIPLMDFFRYPTIRKMAQHLLQQHPNLAL